MRARLRGGTEGRSGVFVSPPGAVFSASARQQAALEGEEVRWGWGECIQPQQGEAPAAAIDALSRCARSLVTAHCATCMIERLSALLSDKTINVNSTD